MKSSDGDFPKSDHFAAEVRPLKFTSAANKWWLLIATIALGGIGTGFVTAGLRGQTRSTTPIDLPKNVGIEPRLGQRVALNLDFRDEDGREVRLADFVNDKPVILSLVYFECPMLCNMVMDGLVRSLRTLSFNVGQEFQVLTVSIDPRESPKLAASAKKTALKRYGREHADAGWHFLTGDERSIRQLADSVGFRFAFDTKTGRIAHGAGLFVLTPSGCVSRYFGGIEFSGRDLRLGLIEASSETIGSAADQVLLLCYHYDPARGTYGLAIMNGIRFSGVVTVLVMTGSFCWMLRRERLMQARSEIP